MRDKKIELLAPAGDMEKLKAAVLYGADAVYLGGTVFSLRAGAKNFNDEELDEAVRFAHNHNAKVYIACNVFARNSDFEKLETYFKFIEEIKADAVLVSDPGVFLTARSVLKNTKLHISTQANTTNFKSCQFWQDSGASRIVTARELSLREIAEIHAKSDIELEAFVHGAMCISYSGRCLLSNYMTARDANRGACSHPCRWKYSLVEETRPGEYFPIVEDENGTFILNSKDLCMIEYIPELIDAGISSFKIEGRMKTSYYVASIVRVYRQAIDDYLRSPEIYSENKQFYVEEIEKASYRGFTTGFYFGSPKDAQVYSSSSYIRNYDFAGMVLEYDEVSGYALVEQRNKFEAGDTIEIIKTDGGMFSQKIEKMYDEQRLPVQSAPHPRQHILIKTAEQVKPFDMIRKRSAKENTD